MRLTLYLSSLIMEQVKKPFGRGSAGENAHHNGEAALDENVSESVILKSDLARIRDQLIEDGDGPADIVFGPDPFDPIYQREGTPYHDALTRGIEAGTLNAGGKTLKATDLDKPISEVFPGKSVREIDEMLSSVVVQIIAEKQRYSSSDSSGA